MSEPIPGQLSIDVPASPQAIGRWTTDDQFSAYRREKGEKKALEQKCLVEESKECNCGAQAKEDEAARDEDRRAKKAPGHTHKAGCPQLRTLGSRSVRISPDEQIRRYTQEGV